MDAKISKLKKNGIELKLSKLCINQNFEFAFSLISQNLFDFNWALTTRIQDESFYEDRSQTGGCLKSKPPINNFNQKKCFLMFFGNFSRLGFFSS